MNDVVKYKKTNIRVKTNRGSQSYLCITFVLMQHKLCLLLLMLWIWNGFKMKSLITIFSCRANLDVSNSVIKLNFINYNCIIINDGLILNSITDSYFDQQKLICTGISNIFWWRIVGIIFLRILHRQWKWDILHFLCNSHILHFLCKLFAIYGFIWKPWFSELSNSSKS